MRSKCLRFRNPIGAHDQTENVPPIHRKGLYVIGNMKMLSKQTIWSEINAKLEQKKQIGTKMTVVCQRHRTQSDIAQGDDFIKKCPEGGCSKVCGLLMKCSHNCPRFCHSQDLEHEKYHCRELCRKLCPSKQDPHPCKLGCHFGKGKNFLPQHCFSSASFIIRYLFQIVYRAMLKWRSHALVATTYLSTVIDPLRANIVELKSKCN